MADTFVPVTFVADELLTSTKMNILAANQARFNDGTGLGDGIIVTRHLTGNAVKSANVDLSSLMQALVQTGSYTIPVRSMTAWTWYSNGSATFNLIEGRTYRIEARGNVPGTMSNVEHMLQAVIGGVNRAITAVSSIGGNAAFAGYSTFVATSTGPTAITLQNRLSGSATGTAQGIELMLTMIN